MIARILQLNLKPQTPGQPGLPKSSVPVLLVSLTGASGDFNAYRTRQLGGDPDQALLLLTTEIIQRLNAEGWPVLPGDLGENITLDGIPDAALRPGTRLRNEELLIEVTRACDPCVNLYTLPYVGDEKGPAFLKATTGRRGWYARVLKGGKLREGASLEVLSGNEKKR